MGCYLVTGGAGFIGSHLVDKLLEANHTVRVLDNLLTGDIKNLNSKAELVEGDICDEKLVQQIMPACDGCFHLAAIASVRESIEKWPATSKTNSFGTIVLLNSACEVLKQHPFYFVYASSAAVYGDSTKSPFKEHSLLHPISPYGVDKRCCEMQAEMAGRLHALPNVGLRLFNVYGERQNPCPAYGGVVSIFIDKLLHNQPIPVFGDGNQVRDFLYVGDAVSYMLSAMQHANKNSLVLNACNGTGTSVNELVTMLAKMTHTTPDIRYQAAIKGDIRFSIGDSTQIEKILHLEEKTPLKEGLIRACRYYTKQFGLNSDF